MSKIIVGLLVTVVLLLGVIAFAVTRSDELSDQEQLDCAVAADYGAPEPYPDCERYIAFPPTDWG